jgi:diguanylate cyclase (GGDEF)-like protein
VRPETQADILLVDDDPTAIVVLSRILGNSGRLRYATNGQDALDLARRQRPDLVLLDIEMPGMSGLDVCRELKRDATWDDVPVIFITSHHSQADELAGLAAGAVDFIAKPPLAPLVRARVATHLRLKRFTDLLKQSAVEDPVTGVGNRRAFEELLPKEWLRALRERTPLSVLMIDVDHFKEYNDALGHQRGDDCLKTVATGLAASAEGRGILLARYGGDEFVLVAPGLAANDAEELAVQLHSVVRAMHVPHPSSRVSDVVTVSIGGSTCAPTPCSGPGTFAGAGSGLLGPEVLLLAADRALYTAKAAGRDQVRFDPMESADDEVGQIPPVQAGLAPGSAPGSGVHD